MYRLARLLGAVVLLSTATASLASAGSLYFDDPAQATDAEGALCCDRSVVDGSTDQLTPSETYSVVTGNSGSINVLDNDGLNEPDLVSVSAPSRGIIVSQPDGARTYFPARGFSGSETLFYRTSNADGSTALSVFVLEMQ
ncbi:MAG: hypothetical protein ACI9MR_000775 [Myxococcota bacterium]|jgi:hypothetical protein